MGKIIQAGSLDEYLGMEDLDETAKKIIKDEKKIVAANPDYKGRIISNNEINEMMNHLISVINNRSKKTSPLNEVKRDASVYYTLSTSDAIREVLGCLRSIDEGLYYKALQLFINAKNDTLTIYNAHDSASREKVKSGEYAGESLNKARGEFSDVFVVLMREMNKADYDRIINIVGKDACSFDEMFVMMHEIAHNFDTDRSNMHVNG